MSNKFLIGLVVLAAGLAIGWYVLQGTPLTTGGGIKVGQATAVPTKAGGTKGGSGTGSGVDLTVPVTTGEVMDKGGISARMVITYTDSGFAPSPVSVKAGTTVTFVNESSRGMWVASAVHPTHQLLPGFDQLKSVAKSGTYEYTFTKVGTWKYHNHVNPTDTGSVVVTQ